MCVRLNVLSRIQGNITVTSAPPPLRSNYCAHSRDRGLRSFAPGKPSQAPCANGTPLDWTPAMAFRTPSKGRLPSAKEGRRHPYPGPPRPKLLGHSVGAPRWLKCRPVEDSSIVFARPANFGGPKSAALRLRGCYLFSISCGHIRVLWCPT